MSENTTPATGLQRQADARIPRARVVAWALWDWGTQPFQTVITTFVFVSLYLVSDSFLPDDVAALADDDPLKLRASAELDAGIGLANAAAGILVALIAPVLGQRADATGGRKLGLGISTGLLLACTAALWFVQADPAWFVLGATLIALGHVFSEIAGVNYNAMLVQVATPRTVGRVSGFGWGMGYLGGVIALAAVAGANAAGWFGMPVDNGEPFRWVAVACAVWGLVFCWQIFRRVPDVAPVADRPRVSFLAGYVVLAKDVRALWRDSRTTFWFLLASAVYRDGLAGVFVYGAVIGSKAFGFETADMVVFGITANLLAGICTMLVGRLEDVVKPRAVILWSLGLILVSGLGVVFLRDLGPVVFWVGGLILSCCVGPAQSASRSFLARVTPAGKESEIFGLYATTGRAASFLSSTAWTVTIAVAGATIWGTLGIVAVVLAGLVLMAFVKTPADFAYSGGRQ
ncbi:MFS transporter [Myceligenerans crystallogenes]|uniref:Proton-coupled antiporter flippase LtaA n=1 Tax=Myceligenerans crystallogenes TaxID=316335 RepID=A0ABP4ZIN4_9MICO